MQSSSLQNTTTETTTTTTTRIISSTNEELESHLMNETVHSFISDIPSDFDLQGSTSLMKTIDELCATHMTTPKKQQGSISSQVSQQRYNKMDDKIQSNEKMDTIVQSTINNPTCSGRGRRGTGRGRGISTTKEVPSIPLLIMNHQFSNTTALEDGISNSIDQDINDDYQQFVTSLKQDHDEAIDLEDDEISYKVLSDEEDHDEDNIIDQLSSVVQLRDTSIQLNDTLQSKDQDSIYNDLNAELSNLAEEDLLASVSSLGHDSTIPQNDAKYISKENQPTKAQVESLRQLLSQHYQLLIQQSIISIRTAYCHKYGQQYEPSDFYSDASVNESSDDLIEILDGSIGMLQDLYDTRNDAIRKNLKGTKLTRSTFRSALREDTTCTNFDIKGIKKLQDTMILLDNCCGDGKVHLSSEEKIVNAQSHNDACVFVLKDANATVIQNVLPSRYNFSNVFTYPCELKGNELDNVTVVPALDAVVTKEWIPTQRSQFTACEDNLILRGVNLYGEKEWLSIIDRFLPDRSVSAISQRYSRLCYLFYKANGVEIDSEGNLLVPPIIQDGQYNEEDASKLKRVKAPLIFDTHRWSLEEDLTLLKAVPIFGNNWAIIRQQLIPHRDRGHLRKRYQVLERRIKGTLKREKGKVGSKKSKLKCQEIIATPKPEPSKTVKKRDLSPNSFFSEFDSLSNHKSASDEEDEAQKCSLPSLSSNDNSEKDEKWFTQRDLPQSQHSFVASSKPEVPIICNEKNVQNAKDNIDTTQSDLDASGFLLCNEDMSPFVEERQARITTPGPCETTTPNKKSSTSFVDKIISIRPKEDANTSCLMSPSFVFATPMNLDCSLLGFERILKGNTNSLLSKVDCFFQNEHLSSCMKGTTPLFSGFSNHTPLFSALSSHSKINTSSMSAKKQITDRVSNEKRNISTEVAAEAMKQEEDANEVNKLLSLDCDTFPNHDENLLSALTFPDHNEDVLDMDIAMNNESSFQCFDVSSMTFEDELLRSQKRQKLESENETNYHSLLHINMSNTVGTQQLDLSHNIMSPPVAVLDYSLNEKQTTNTASVNNKRSLFDVAIGSIQDKKRVVTRNK